MSGPPQPERELFDVVAAAEYLRTLGADTASRNLIRTLIASGQLPFVRLGKKFFVRRCALDEWIVRHERRRRG